MKINWKSILGVFILVALLPAILPAVTVVYTNNDLTATNGGNSVSAYTVEPNGTLGLIGTYNTGGNGTGGGLYAANRITVVGNFLYASNAGSNTVSAFKIDKSTGALIPNSVAGSPFATGSYNSTSESGISLAATPDGQYLFAGSTGFQNVTVFSIDSGGALSMVGSPVYVAGTMSSMKVTPDGHYLVMAFPDAGAVAVYSITGGSLQAVTNPPFDVGGRATGVDIDCASRHVFVGFSGSNIVKVYNIDPSSGALSLNSVSDAIPSVSSAQVVQLSPDDATLYVSNQAANVVSAFNVTTDTSGNVTLSLAPGTPVDTGNSNAYPGGLAINADGTFLFAGDTGTTPGVLSSPFSAISVFGVGGSTPVAFDSYMQTSTIYGLHSVAAYPPKACALAPTSLAGTLQISDGPPPSYNLNITADLGSGADPLTQPVTLAIGDYSVTISAGSFRLHQQGTNAGIYVFQGAIDGVTLKVQIVALGGNQFQIAAFGKQVDTSQLTNPVTVTIGGNSASATVTITTGDYLRGLWHDQ